MDFEKLAADTAELIDSYVEKDPTKFCTYNEFKTGVEAISRFCTLRAESVNGQLEGTIPSTTEGQKADSSALIDADGLNTSDMGSMGGGMGGFGGGQKGGSDRTGKPDKSDRSDETDNGKSMQKLKNTSLSLKKSSNIKLLKIEERPDFGGQPPQGFGGEMPEGFDPGNMPDFGGGMPEGFDPGNMPEDFDPENMPGGLSPFGEGGKTDEDTADEDDDTEAAEKPAGSEEAVSSDGDAAPQNKPKGGERPDMAGFSPMNDTPQQDNKAEYILLGVSALVLLMGLGFAAKFRR